eukprot:TRINITY_DN6569_c0_g1_i2.p1 TRINITY_DN6569_c0_g1~~TRINITY_DN6569_c0_g1_i2.p1  ORF type:complete len:339 (+),score=88.39 TRINITY_DN6569_c0_g1_i2:1108-2124(+)
MNFLCAAFILHMEEEDALWLLETTIGAILPKQYYTNELQGVLADTWVLNFLAERAFPKLMRHLSQLEVVLDVFVAKLFLCLYVNELPLDACLWVLDLFFSEGNTVLFRVLLGMLRAKEKDLLAMKQATEIMLALSNIAKTFTLSQVMESTLAVHLGDKGRIEELRRRALQQIEEQNRARRKEKQRRNKPKAPAPRPKPSIPAPMPPSPSPSPSPPLPVELSPSPEPLYADSQPPSPQQVPLRPQPRRFPGRVMSQLLEPGCCEDDLDMLEEASAERRRSAPAGSIRTINFNHLRRQIKQSFADENFLVRYSQELQQVRARLTQEQPAKCDEPLQGSVS